MEGNLITHKEPRLTVLKLVATIVVVGTLAVPGIASADELFRAVLTGDQEVPNPVVTTTTGRAFVLVNQAETAAEFHLHVSDGVGITQSHIHCAPAGVNGPVVVFLAGFHSAGLDIDGKWISNATFTQDSIVNTTCGSTIAELVQSMRDGNTYVNVHSVANRGGEVRGQLGQ